MPDNNQTDIKKQGFDPTVLFGQQAGGTITAILVDANGKVVVNTHNKGYFVDEAALNAAHPTGTNGDYAIVGSTDTVWIWDGDTSAWVDSGMNGAVISVNGLTGAVVLTTANINENTNLYYTEARVNANTNVAANTSHRSSDGKNHADVVSNNAHRAGNGSDHADVATNSAARHSRLHAITGTSDHSAGNWKVVYTNGSGQVIELALPAAGKVFTGQGVSAPPTFETPDGQEKTFTKSVEDSAYYKDGGSNDVTIMAALFNTADKVSYSQVLAITNAQDGGRSFAFQVPTGVSGLTSVTLTYKVQVGDAGNKITFQVQDTAGVIDETSGNGTSTSEATLVVNSGLEGTYTAGSLIHILVNGLGDAGESCYIGSCKVVWT